MLLIASSGAYGQVTVVPSVSVSETLTNNVRLASDGQQSEQITEISAGVRINIDGATLKTFFDYSLTSVMYAQHSSPDSTHYQNGLNTFGTLEVVDGWAFVDFNGSISQQAVSAFGTQSIDNAAINANKAEVAHYRLSPYVRGRLGDMASYEARYSRSVTNSDTAEGSGVNMVDGSVRLSGASVFSNLGWSTDFSRQSVSYSAGRTTEADSVSLGLSYTITPQLNVFVNAGREANNYTSLNKQSSGTSGFGVNWSPSEMTTISAQKDHRSFGDTHNLSFAHRTARTIWRFTDSKDVSATPSQTGIASLGSIYDLLYSQFASLEPNPTARAQLVNAYLQANGISPNAIVVSSFLTAAVSLQRRQDLSLALLGVRDTVTFIATRSEGSRLDTVSTGVDDFSNSSLVRQRGFMVNYAHRLTPDYSLGVLVSQQNTSGVSSQQDITLHSFNINVTGRVGRKATASIAVRRVVSSGSTSSYTETAVIGSLIVQF